MVTELSHTGSTEAALEVCRFCGDGPIFTRPGADEPRRPGICRGCLMRLTEEALDLVADLSGLPREGADVPHVQGAASSDEGEDVWDRFDSAMASRHLLSGVKGAIDCSQEQIDYTWGGGPAHKSSARIDADCERVCSILTRHGYREVSVEVGVDVELAADQKLGGFHRTPDTDEPRWTARVIFKRASEPERRTRA